VIASTRHGRQALGLAFLGMVVLLVVWVAVVLRSAADVPKSQAPAPVAAGGWGVSAHPVETARRVQVLAAADPEAAVTTILSKEYGVTCMNASDVLIREDPEKLTQLDAKLVSKGLTTGWIDEGVTFAGDGTAAARAFKAAHAFGDEASVWIVVAGAKPSAVELRSAKTPAGHTVWASTNQITVC